MHELLRQAKAWEHEVFRQPDEFKEAWRGQKPKYFVVACVDSRVPASSGLRIGEAFCFRNMGNVIDPNDAEIVAALTYFVRHLPGEGLLVVQGHSACGAVLYVQKHIQMSEPFSSALRPIVPARDECYEALLRGEVFEKARELAGEARSKIEGEGLKVEELYRPEELPENIASELLQRDEPSFEAMVLHYAVVLKNIENQLENARKIKELREAEEEGKLRLVKQFYDLYTGSLLLVE